MKMPPLIRSGLVVFSLLVLVGCSAESKRARVLEKASLYYKAGEFEKARIEYQNVLQGDPDNMTANERLALIWLERGSPKRAGQYLVKMKTLAPGNLDLRLKLGQLMLSLGSVADARLEAIHILERSTAVPDALVLLTESIRSPDDLRTAERVLEKFSGKGEVGYLIALSNLQMMRGNVAEAKNSLRRAITNEPKAFAPRLALANHLAAQNHTMEALAEYKQAAELAPVKAPARLLYAGYLAQTGSGAAAVNYLKGILEQVPDYVPALRSLAQIALNEKRFPEAQAYIERVFGSDAYDHDARLLRAQMWMMQGDVKKAVDDLELFGKDYPGLGIEKHQLGLAYLKNNDVPNAIKALQEAVGRNADNVEAIMLLAQLQLRNGSPQSAAAMLTDLVSRHPNVLQTYPLLVEAMRVQGKLEQGGAAVLQGIKASPSPQLYYLLGLILSQLSKPAEARQSFEKALHIAPDYTPASAELVALDLREKKLPAAAEKAKALIIRLPRSPMGHILQAQIHAAEEKWESAEISLAKALELQGHQPVVYGLLTDSFLARKNDPATEGRLENLLKSRPNDEFLVLTAGRFYTQTNNFTKACEVYERFLAAHPNATMLMNNLASLYDERMDKSDQALELAQRARKLEPNSYAVADTLGWILYRRKNFQEAAPLLELAAKGMANNPEVQYHFGLVNQALGKKDEAVIALRVAATASSEFPGKEDAKRQLAVLEVPK